MGVNLLPARLSRQVMYDYLLIFTFLLLLMHVTYILTPDCVEEHGNVFESTQDSSAEKQRYIILGNENHLDEPKLQTLGGQNVYYTTIGAGKEKPLPHQEGRGQDDKRSLKMPRKITNELSKTKLASQNAPRQRNRTVKHSPILPHNKSSSLKAGGKRNFMPSMQNNSKMKSFKFSDESINKTNKIPARCQKKILIYGGIKVVRQWIELQVLVAALQLQDNGDWSTEVSCDQCTAQLILSNNMESLQGKDAIVFGMSPYSLKVKMATFRSYDFHSSQLLVFYGAETPLRMRKWVPDVGNLPVDVVWSYGQTSDIHIPYGYYQAGHPMDATRKSLPARTQGKRKLVAWMGSNCVKEVFWPRMNFVRKLQAHVPVDIYGKCGNLTCLPRLSSKCKDLMNQYKFYLSLENAECDDYATEKFWETALVHGVVPVVYGAPKRYYIQNAPPNSFIYAGDYRTVKQLAGYLISLDRSPQKYAEYLEWRYSGSVKQNFPNLKLAHFCGILPHIGSRGNGHAQRRNLAETTWFNSCRKMRRGDKAFRPADINATNWVPW
ncbi:uncharacterized protein LOC110978133 [Acanthaster planci]|uniref:Fucosyltransferase n=1 Tax=Acanthaster planci TaxID=133434 RepID=A0A8B7Y5U6_ACAPL|nr:uncharacterized protein LOC110978133 [Acanthaster planci]XP_022088568.1 uncharacterized protein LOC110978133 [Acanthaster planci]XP_022088569.1 uncharacterized protein LOC110978133 [Acanthaster planci]